MKRKAIPKKTREFVMERDEHRCTRCGITEELVIHHELPVSEGGGVEPENLKVLCMACHKTVHIERGDDYAMDMASTRGGFLSRIPEYDSRGAWTVCDTAGLRKEFGFSDDEIAVVQCLYEGCLKYPNLTGVVKQSKMDELDVARALLLLVDGGHVIVTRAPERTNLYRVDRKRYDAYFGVRLLFCAEDGRVVHQVDRGTYWEGHVLKERMITA